MTTMLKDYFNYVQNVLGVKSFILPLPIQEEVETSYHFAVATLSEPAREILMNIIKALKAQKYDILELKIERSVVGEKPADGPVKDIQKTKSVLIIFGADAARFLIPNTQVEIGQVQLLSGSQTLVTHSIEDMREKPELKREAWQHLKVFVNVS